MKKFYCANCSAALEVKIGVVKGDTVRVVAPHDCGSEEEVHLAIGEFVSKLNELSPPKRQAPPQAELPNKDVEDLQRKEATTTAPPGIKAQMEAMLGETGLGSDADPRTVTTGEGSED